MVKFDSKVDVAVLIIFFNRPNVLSKVFEKVKMARPSKLFLYQDGKRIGNENDEILIEECREIVKDIDWKCEVYKKYQEQNFGCDPSEFIAQKWVFSIVDKCIILEDDDVPEITFFRFCKELLDYYEHDTRICRISGMNQLGIYNTDYSYFFTTSGSIWGWATWKRVVDAWDPSYSFLDNSEEMILLKKYCKSVHINFKQFIKTCRRHRSAGKNYYESIFYSYRLMNSALTIVPSRNMISNIGLTADSTHSTSNIRRLPKGIQRVFMMEIYPMEFPLVHPSHIINDLNYVKKVNSVMGFGLIKRTYRMIETAIRRIIFHER